MTSIEYLGDTHLFPATLELPDNINSSAPGLVICYPTGHEHTHSYSTMVQLARQLRKRGIPSLRFDYPGTANAMGDLCNLDSVDPWIDAIAQATECLKARTGVTRTGIFGSRLGATLAALAVARAQASILAVWNPVMDGRTLVRDLEMIGDPVEQDQPEVLSAGGFHYGKALLKAISQLKLSDADLSGISNLTFLDRNDAPTGEAFCQSAHLKHIDVTYLQVGGYAETFRQPQYSTVAQEVIHQVCELMVDAAANVSPTTSGTPQTSLPGAVAVRQLALQNGVTEQPVEVALGHNQGFAILTSPPAEKLRKAIVWPNTGAAHHIGPGRLHVDIARKLAQHGIAVLRMDLRNIGDSVGEATADLNDPYPATAAEDVAAAAHWLKKALNVPQVAIAGICSGAYGGLHAAAKLDRGIVSDLLMVNPEHFLTAPPRAMPTRHSSIGAQPSGFFSYWQCGLQWLRKPLKLVHRLVNPGWLPWRSQLYRILADLKDSGVEVIMIFAQHDDRINIVQRLCGSEIQRMETLQIARVRTIADADHLFSTQASRGELGRQIVQYLEVD